MPGGQGRADERIQQGVPDGYVSHMNRSPRYTITILRIIVVDTLNSRLVKMFRGRLAEGVLVNSLKIDQGPEEMSLAEHT